MNNSQHLYPRLIQSRITEALLDTPVVLVTGPRQSGKTTLVRQIATKGMRYLTLDDKVGNRKQREEDTVITDYSYDDTYQLTQAKIGPSEENYTWDKVGNRRAGPTVKEVLDSSYVHDNTNRMNQGRKLSYQYDDLGNQTKRIIATGKEWTFYWDGENKLKKAELVKDTVTLRRLTFKYDPFGRRIEKQVTNNPDTTPNITTTTYFYDQEDIVFTSVNDGTTTSKTHYVHGPGIDEPLAMVKDGQASYYHADGLGSIAAITDDQGTIVQRYSYDAFGQLTASDPTFDNFYTYTGREYDKETGLYYYRARYYDAMEGRFISKDPIGLAGGINQYAYVGNNSVNFIDPSGLLTFTENFNRRKDINNRVITGTVKTLTSMAVGSSFNAHARRAAGLGTGFFELIKNRGVISNLSRLGSLGHVALSALYKAARVGGAFWFGQQVGFGMGAYVDTLVDDNESLLGFTPEQLESVGFGSGYKNTVSECE